MLVIEEEATNEEIKNEIEDAINNDDKKEEDISNDIDSRQQELIKLAEDRGIDQSVKYIRKASSKIIAKLYAEYKEKRLQRANKFLKDLLISKFSRFLWGLDEIESPDVMEDELRKDDLLRRDVGNLVNSLTPYIPYLGFISGCIIVRRHVSSDMLNKQAGEIDNKTVGSEGALTKENQYLQNGKFFIYMTWTGMLSKVY